MKVKFARDFPSNKNDENLTAVVNENPEVATQHTQDNNKPVQLDKIEEESQKVSPRRHTLHKKQEIPAKTKNE